MKQPTRLICWFGCLSSGVDPWFLLIPGQLGISQVVQKSKKKKKKKNRGWKEEKTKHEFRTAKCKKVKFGTFFKKIFLHSVCMYVFGYYKCIVKLLTATKNADLSLITVFIA